MHERRKRRSDDPLIALHYQLAEARAAGLLDAIVVADAAGLMVAGAGSWPACEELAAYAPLLHRQPGDGALSSTARIDLVGRHASVARLSLDDQRDMLVCARGGRAEADRAVALAGAASAVVRILHAA
jgi:hypothetical protein